jgi:hypothetical protein
MRLGGFVIAKLNDHELKHWSAWVIGKQAFRLEERAHEHVSLLRANAILHG